MKGLKVIAVLVLLLLSPLAAISQNVAAKQSGGEEMKAFIGNGRGSAKTQYQGKSIDRMIYEFMEQEDVPGLTLAIVQAPYISRVAGYGRADLKYGTLASTRTLWALGPMSQTYAAVAAMQLVEDGKIDLKKPITYYISGLPATWKAVTVMELLQHASGIPDFREAKDFEASKKYTAQEITALVKSEPLLFKAGTNVSQSATNTVLLTMIIAEAAGMGYEDFVMQRQIKFLGLKQTVFASDLNKLNYENLAKTAAKHELFKSDKAYIDPIEPAAGYRAAADGIEPAPAQMPIPGYYDLWASAYDVSFWDIALAGSVLIKKPQNRDIIYKPTKLPNGMVVRAVAGWQFPFHKGLMYAGGSSTGFTSYLSRFTDASELVCVTLLANKEGLELNNLARRIAAAFWDELGSGANDNELYTYESVYDVNKTAALLKKELKRLNIPVFAEFDHEKNAQEVDLDLRPTKVIVFGSPAVGTKLMQKSQSAAAVLPLKITIWQDEKGSTWVAFPLLELMAQRYDLQDSPIIPKMRKLMETLVQKSSAVYNK